MRAGAVVAVWMNVAKENEPKINEFYELEHVEHVLEVDGFLSGYRYYNAEGPLRFLTLYEAVDEDVEPGPGFQKLVVEPSPRAVRVRKLYQETRRTNYIVRLDTGPTRDPGAIIGIHSSEGPGAAMPHAMRETMLGSTRYRALQAANDANVWFEVWDFQNVDSARSIARRAPGRKDARVETYEAIGTPRMKRFPAPASN